jgi:hypothetical protein
MLNIYFTAQQSTVFLNMSCKLKCFIFLQNLLYARIIKSFKSGMRGSENFIFPSFLMFPEIFLLVDRLDSFLHRLRLWVDDWHFQEWIEFPEVFLAEHVRPTACRHGDEEHSPRYMVWWCVLDFTFVLFFLSFLPVWLLCCKSPSYNWDSSSSGLLE